MILSDRDIEEFQDRGEIKITNFSGQLEPASYDLRVGKHAYTEEGRLDVEALGFVTISRGATVIIYPKEGIELGTTVAARFGLRSSLARKGLLLLSGPQIDPGFAGILMVTIFNAGPAPVPILFDQKFVTVEFAELRTAASEAYAGAYQGQEQPSTEEISLVTSRYKNITELEDRLNELHPRFSVIERIVELVFLAVVAGLVIVGMQRLLG